MLSTDRKPALIDVHKCILIRAIPKDWNTETGIWNLESGINDIENYERKNSLQQCLINNNLAVWQKEKPHGKKKKTQSKKKT